MKRSRRAFIGTLAGGFLGAALGIEAHQAAKVYRVGLLGGSPPNSPGGRRAWEGFFQGMRELGYVEGQNILVEGRWYGERTDRLPALAAELVRLKVDVIVAGAPPRSRGGPTRHVDDPDRHGESYRSGREWARSQPCKTGEERYGSIHSLIGAGWQAAAITQGGDSRNLPRGRALESDRSCPGA